MPGEPAPHRHRWLGSRSAAQSRRRTATTSSTTCADDRPPRKRQRDRAPAVFPFLRPGTGWLGGPVRRSTGYVGDHQGLQGPAGALGLAMLRSVDAGELAGRALVVCGLLPGSTQALEVHPRPGGLDGQRKSLRHCERRGARSAARFWARTGVSRRAATAGRRPLVEQATAEALGLAVGPGLPGAGEGPADAQVVADLQAPSFGALGDPYESPMTVAVRR